MSIIEEKWEEIIDLLCTDYSVSYLSYQTWLKPMKVKDFHGNTLTISTGKEEGVAFISRKYRKQIETSVRDVTGIECNVVFESEGGSEDGSISGNKAVDPMILKKIDEAILSRISSSVITIILLMRQLSLYLNLPGMFIIHCLFTEVLVLERPI